MFSHLRLGLAVAVAVTICGSAVAQNRQPQLPDNVATRHADIWSEGTRISGDLFYPKDLTPESGYPAIVMSHGWGGTRGHLNTYAPIFAAEGYVVLTIDYRGWGDSDSKLVIEGPMPKPDENGMVTVKARAIREVVDPFDQVIDIGHAIDYIVGEPGVDASRIGLWGSSYSGGHVVYVAGHDSRVKCIVSQVSAQNSTDIVASMWAEQGGLEYAGTIATKRARGEIDPIPQDGEDKAPNLSGTPMLDKVMQYRPVDFAANITAATLLIDAEKEELFDIRDHSARVYDIMKNRGVAPVKYVVVPGITHYGIYTAKRADSVKLAVDWFGEYLKGE